MGPLCDRSLGDFRRRLSRLFRLRCILAKLFLLASRRGQERVAPRSSILCRLVLPRCVTRFCKFAQRAESHAVYLRRMLGNDMRNILAVAFVVASFGAFAPAVAIEPVPLSPGWARAMPPGPDVRVKITEEYARQVGRDAYFWAWPMVNMYNRRLHFMHVKEMAIRGPLMEAPVNRLAMLTDYVEPKERAVACPNQDVVYGIGALALDISPSWSRCRISAIDSGSIRSSICAPTASCSSARCTRRARFLSAGRPELAGRSADGNYQGFPVPDQYRPRRAARRTGRYAGRQGGDPVGAEPAS